MNPIQRKANSVEMNNNDRRDAKGGLRRLRRPRLLTYAAALACVAAVSVAAGAAANRPSLARPTGLETFQLRLHDSRARPRQPRSGVPDVLADAVFRVGSPCRGATRYEFELSTSRELRRRQRPHLVEQDADDSGRRGSDLAAVDHGRPGVAVLARAGVRR